MVLDRTWRFVCWLPSSYFFIAHLYSFLNFFFILFSFNRVKERKVQNFPPYDSFASFSSFFSFGVRHLPTIERISKLLITRFYPRIVFGKSFEKEEISVCSFALCNLNSGGIREKSQRSVITTVFHIRPYTSNCVLELSTWVSFTRRMKKGWVSKILFSLPSSHCPLFRNRSSGNSLLLADGSNGTRRRNICCCIRRVFGAESEIHR